MKECLVCTAVPVISVRNCFFGTLAFISVMSRDHYSICSGTETRTFQKLDSLSFPVQHFWPGKLGQWVRTLAVKLRGPEFKSLELCKSLAWMCIPVTPVRGMDRGREIPRSHWMASVAKRASHINVLLGPFHWCADMHTHTPKGKRKKKKSIVFAENVGVGEHVLGMGKALDSKPGTKINKEHIYELLE